MSNLSNRGGTQKIVVNTKEDRFTNGDNIFANKFEWSYSNFTKKLV